jgi:hypothetical protein
LIHTQFFFTLVENPTAVTADDPDPFWKPGFEVESSVFAEPHAMPICHAECVAAYID